MKFSKGGSIMKALKEKKGLPVFVSLFLLVWGLTFIPAENVAQTTTQGGRSAGVGQVA